MSISTAGRAVEVEAKGRKKLRAGVVGVGRMGRHHARVYSQLADTQLVGVVDADPDRAESFAEQYGCKGLASVETLLKQGVDVVSIAVPTTHHRAMAEPLLRAGVACLIEKPLAGDVAEAERIKAAADASGAILMVGHIERFNPIMRALKKEQGTGLPIVPRFMEMSRVSPMTFRSIDTSVVMDMMIHDLDVIIMLMDGAEPDEVYASGVPVITEHEDICSARLVFRRPYGTCVANVTSSRLAFKTERITRITGENAYVKIDYGAKAGSIIRRLANEEQMRQVREQLRQGDDLTNVKWQDLVQIEELQVDEGEPIVMEIQSFIDAVKEGRHPEIDARAGLANVRTAERIIEAARKERGAQSIHSTY